MAWKNKKLKIAVFLMFAVLFLWTLPGVASEDRDAEGLSLEKFVELACSRDRVFEEILIENLKLNYRKKLELPADDIVLSAKSDYVAFIKPGDKGYPVYEMSLSKLFPYTGTELGAGYGSTGKPYLAGDIDAEFYARVSQPIARNAFGKATRLLDRIVGLEVEVARYQVVEAYERYLASIIHIYYNWYEAYENVKTAENSYKESMKLLSNVKERAKNNIALPVDVNKVRLQVLGKKENLIELKSRYDEQTNLLKKSLGYGSGPSPVPVPADKYDDMAIDFEKEYARFRKEGRTSRILDLLEEKSSLEIDRDADSLLPSVDLYAEYSIKAADRMLRRDEKRVFAGVSVQYPFPGQVARAEYETAKIEHKRQELETENTHLRIYTMLRNIYREIKKTRELIDVAGQKVATAQSIVDDDMINYSYGRVILNNFIDEVNKLDANRFSKIQHTIKLKKLIIDWLVLTDRLIDKERISGV